MAGSRVDIQGLLATGSFQTARSKSPRPTNRSTNPPEALPSYPSPTLDHRVPRSFGRKSERRPPPPSVEDEKESLAREYGSSPAKASIDEEAKSRGEVDQFPIIIDLKEYHANPERSFILVSSGKGKDEKHGLGNEQEQAADDEYLANTARKYDAGPPSNLRPKPATKRASSERRKSGRDLPQIDTDFDAEAPASAAMQRSRSATTGNPNAEDDYFSGRHNSRPYGEGLSSPRVIKHASGGGREKVYLDYGRVQNGRNPMQRARSGVVEDRRSDDNGSRTPPSSSPAAGKRTKSDFDGTKHSRLASGDRYGSSSRQRGEYVHVRDYERSPSPPSSRPGRESVSKRASSYARRDSPSRKESGYAEAGEASVTRAPSYRRRKTIITQEGKDNLLTPDQAQQTTPSRSRSKGPTSPLPSPRPTDGFSQDPRASGRSLGRGQGNLPPSYPPYPEEEEPSSRPKRQVGRGADPDSRPRSRGPPLVISTVPMPIPNGPRSPTDRRKPAVPSPNPNSVSGIKSSRQQSQSWQPPPFSPEQNAQMLGIDRPIGSYRRYSEDVDRGGLPDLPDCKRTNGVIGMMDWLTLPRCDNFDICPDCYTAVFAGSRFRSQFVPVPWRPKDKKIICDFGASPWYRIAWLLTLQNRIPDLRLFSDIAAVSADVYARNQPCSGSRLASRVWYSIKSPASGRVIPEFNVCFECTRTIEVLLPILRGVFVRLESSNRARQAVCSMHYDPDRKRFVSYFDAMETTSDRALIAKETPDIMWLASEIELLSSLAECSEDKPQAEKKWHLMQHLPELTVCGDCFDEVVRPRLKEGSLVARTFYLNPQRLPLASCQLYSDRMRDVFKTACRRNDADLLEATVLQRREKEAEIHSKLARLDREGRGDVWTEEAIDKLIREWKKWE